MLQMRPDQYKDIIIRLSKMVDKTNNCNARASILWLIGEHCDKVPKIAPDVLRRAVRSFPDEPEAVKFQIINLASKLFIMNSKQTHVLCQYVFLLSKYDLNYDVRDRSRLLQNLIYPSSDCILPKYAKKILFSSKPAPVLRSAYKDREVWQLGTMSHYLNCKVSGYKPLPEYPSSVSETSVRDIKIDFPDLFEHKEPVKEKAEKNEDFYSSFSDSSSEYSSSSYESEGETDNNSEIEHKGSSFSSISSLSSSCSNHLKFGDNFNNANVEALGNSAIALDVKSQSGSSSSSLERSNILNHEQSSKDKLLLFDDTIGENLSDSNVLKPSTFDDSLLNPSSAIPTQSTHLKSENFEPVGPSFVSKQYEELVNKYLGKGLVIHYRMLRRILFSRPNMLEIELVIENKKTSGVINDLVVSADKNTSFYLVNEVGPIGSHESYSFSIGIDFKDSLHPANLIFTSIDHQLKISTEIRPSMGDMVLPIQITIPSFLDSQKALGGMNMMMAEVNLSFSFEIIHQRILELCNLNPIKFSENSLLYAGVTASHRLITLVSLTKDQMGKYILKVNCSDMIASGMLFKDIKNIL